MKDERFGAFSARYFDRFPLKTSTFRVCILTNWPISAQVEEIQLVYMGLLEAYVYSHREEPASSLGAQLSLLTELRYLYKYTVL